MKAVQLVLTMFWTRGTASSFKNEIDEMSVQNYFTHQVNTEAITQIKSTDGFVVFGRKKLMALKTHYFTANFSLNTFRIQIKVNFKRIGFYHRFC